MDLLLVALGATVVMAVVDDVPSTISWPGPAPVSTTVIADQPTTGSPDDR